MNEPPRRYVSADEDSARWLDFPIRPGDIVISTRSKGGTTWVQMICALLIFQNPIPPSSLSALSPWLDMLVTTKDEMYAHLAAQQHRRFIKTHTPLDGLPLDDRATYIVVGRDPLDMAVSLYHQGDNIDRPRLRQLTAQPEQVEPPTPRPGLREWLLAWIDRDVSPLDEMDSLPGVMWHLADAWARRSDPNIVLVHYDDLLRDLPGQMSRIALLLGMAVPENLWPTLVEAARFPSMQARAELLAPNPSGVLKDTAAFFRRGVSGSGRALLTGSELAHFRSRIERMGSPDLVEWLHR